MLLELAISHWGLIDEVRLTFGGGLNVLTGETGTGKSMVIDALTAILGGAAASEAVRSGQDRAVLEAMFDLGGDPGRIARLQDMGLAVGEDGLLLVRREVAAAGRGSIRIGGRPATLAMLKEATETLVDIHGQHEHQSLLQQEKHLDLLDQYGGSLLTREGRSLDVLDAYGGQGLLALRQQLAHLVAAVRQAQHGLKELLGDGRDRARRLDLLRFQAEELRTAKLRSGELAELEAERQVLAHGERLRQAAESGYARLYEGAPRQLSVTDLLGQVRSELQEAARLDPALHEALELLDGALAQVSEASHFLAVYRDRVDVSPERLAQVDARLDLLHNLQRKYGSSEDEMLAYLRQMQAEIDRLEHAEEAVAALQDQEAAAGRQAAELAATLTGARQAAAAELSRRVERELGDLGMAGAQLQVAVTTATPGPGTSPWSTVTARGWDRVEFLFAPNRGEPPRPLARIVSGGEMSRIMLALKVILARVDGVPTLVFDEVDAGIGGRAAQAVAEKLAVIARDRQVLCVTHLAQVAAMADTHLQVSKSGDGGRTVTTVATLGAAEQAEEIARMVAGAAVTPLTLDAAREMLRQAGGLKQALRAG